MCDILLCFALNDTFSKRFVSAALCSIRESFFYWIWAYLIELFNFSIVIFSRSILVCLFTQLSPIVFIYYVFHCCTHLVLLYFVSFTLTLSRWRFQSRDRYVVIVADFLFHSYLLQALSLISAKMLTNFGVLGSVSQILSNRGCFLAMNIVRVPAELLLYPP